MRRICILFFLLAAMVSRAADERVTLRITITNLPVTGNNLSFSAPATKVITWSNVTTSAFVQTNLTKNGCATNLFLQIAANAPWIPRPALVWANTNAFDLVAEVNQSIAVTNSGTWATLTLSTQTVTRLTTVRVPISGEVGDTNRTNVASLLAKGISDYSTNPIANVRLTNVVGLNGTTHRLTNGWYTNAAIDKAWLTNGVADGLRLTNAIGLHGTNHLLYGGTIEAATIANSTITNVNALHGTLLGLTNGVLTGTRLTNGIGINGTVNRLTNGYYTNSIMDRPLLTNGVNYGNAFSSQASGGGEQFGQSATATGSGTPLAVGVSADASGEDATAIGALLTVASGDRSVAVGSETEATGEDATAVGAFAVASKPGAVAIGKNAGAGNTNSTALGAFAQTDADDQVMLGSSTVAYVKAYGRFTAGSMTNNVFTGTNVFRGAVAWEEVVVSSFANGNNIAAAATNKFIRLVASGPTAAFTLAGIQGGWSGRELLIWNDTGQAFTLLHQSGLDPTPANRIYSTSQGDIVFPTNSLFMLIYSGSVSRWIYGAANTNATLANNSVTDGILRDSAALSVIGRSANSTGDPADIAASANGQVLVRTNSTLTFGKIGLHTDYAFASSSSDLRGVISDEVGSGSLMFTRSGVYREIWIPAGAITPATTNGAALGTNTVGADGLTLDVLDFDDTTAEYGWFNIAMPDGWDHSTIKAKFVWTTITGSGGVVWGLAGGAVADDGTLNGTILGTAQTVADTRLADHDLHLTSATSAITVGGTPTLSKPVFFRVHRLPSDGSDTKTGDARLIGIKIQYLESTTEASAW